MTHGNTGKVRTEAMKEKLRQAGKAKARRVSIDDVVFRDVSVAAKHYKVCVKTCYNRINSEKFPNWKYHFPLK